MTTLKDMGIQQWRLRRSAAEIIAQTSASESVSLPNINADEPIDVIEANKKIWPSPQPQASNSSLSQQSNQQTESEKTENTAESENPVLVPSPSAEKNTEKQQLQLKVVPMPAPMPLSSLDGNNETAGDIISDDSSDQTLLNEEHVVSNNRVDNLEWRDLQDLVDGWQHCPTCGDQKSLLGHGNVNADWLFVSDAPSRPEIEQGQLYSGREGMLFDAMLSALGLNRQKVYSTSLFKCMASDDMSVIPTCDDILQRQIELIQPKVIITLGEFVSQTLLKSNNSLDVLRTQQQVCLKSKVAVVPSFAPSQMLDGAELKPKVWSDLKRAIALVNSGN